MSAWYFVFAIEGVCVLAFFALVVASEFYGENHDADA